VIYFYWLADDHCCWPHGRLVALDRSRSTRNLSFRSGLFGSRGSVLRKDGQTVRGTVAPTGST